MENNKRKQISEFYKQIFSDEKLKERFKEKAKKIASEEDLRKLIREEIMPLMEKYNVSFSENELIEFEKGTLNEMSDELFDEALEGVTGGLSRPTIAGGLLALTLVASGATALGQTSYAAEIGTDSDTSITQTVDTNEDAEENDENDEVDVDIEDEEEAAEISNEAEEDADNDKEAEASSKTDDSTASDIKDVVDTVNSIFNRPLNFAFNETIDSQKLYRIKDKFKFVYDRNNMLHVAVGEEIVFELDNVAPKLQNRTKSLNIPEEWEAYKWDVDKAIALNNQLNSVSEPTSEMKEDLYNLERSINNGTFKGELPMFVARSLISHLNAVKDEDLVKSFKSNSTGVFSLKSLNAHTYDIFLKSINNPDYFKAGTSTLNDESEETKNLKTKLQMACNHVYITPKGEAYVNGHTDEADKKLSPNTLKKLASFAQDNSGYEIKARKCTTADETLSEVVKFAIFNNVSAISQEQADQWYASWIELNQSSALNELSPEMKDKLDVFVLEGREAGIFSAEEISDTNNGQSSSILARVASATVSAVGSTIKGAGKLVGKIFSLWK